MESVCFTGACPGMSRDELTASQKCFSILIAIDKKYNSNNETNVICVKLHRWRLFLVTSINIYDGAILKKCVCSKQT